MAIIHANQPGAVHNIEPGSIGDRDISSGDPIDAVTKIKNLDKVKGIKGDIGATGPAVSLAANTFILGTAAAAGIATTAPRADDTIAAFDITAPTTSALADAATVGTVAFAARRDHRHGRESFATNAIVLGTAAAAGVATTPNRSDDTIAAFDATAPTTSAVGDAAAVGIVARAARRDHTHGREAFGTPGSSAVGDTAAAGTATTETRSDHVHGREAFATNAILLSTAAAAGLATTPMRSNDTIAAFDATVPVTQASGDAAATGTVAFAARRDHRHGMPTMATLAINALVLGTAAAAGIATTAPRTDDTIAAFDTTVPTTAASGDAAATGSIAFAARRDHRHGMPVLLVGTPTVTVVTATATWTRAAGTAFVRVIAIGSGGGGGAVPSPGAGNAQAAGGGGAGSYSEKWMTGTAAGASQTVTIGAAGAGGLAGANNGAAGADCSFGILVVGKGGSGGLTGTNNGFVQGGAGGIAGTGDITAVGNAGGAGLAVNGAGVSQAVVQGGQGGASALGGAALAVTGNGTVVSVAGNAGGNYGAGGGGAIATTTGASAAGGAGNAGVVYIIEVS